MNDTVKNALDGVLAGLGDSEKKMFTQIAHLVKLSVKSSHLEDPAHPGCKVVTISTLEIPIMGFEIAIGGGHGGSEEILKKLMGTECNGAPLLCDYKIFQSEDGETEFMSVVLPEDVITYMDEMSF